MLEELVAQPHCIYVYGCNKICLNRTDTRHICKICLCRTGHQEKMELFS